MAGESVAVPDPKWLAVLKASWWQTLSISVAAIVVLIALSKGSAPGTPWWVSLIALFAAVLCGFLCLGSIGKAVYGFAPLQIWVVHLWNNHNAVKNAEAYIPHMQEREREIVAYLLHHNQKVFQADAGGGFAAPLISQRIIVRALQPGQVFYADDTPFAVPDPVWKVLVEHRHKFPYTEPARHERRGHPWRVPII